MEITRILAEHLIPGMMFNVWILISLDTMSNGRLWSFISSPNFPSWLGNFIVLMLIATSYFFGVLISSIMLFITRPLRSFTTRYVSGFSEFIEMKKNELLKSGIASDKDDFKNKRKWYRIYEGINLYVWRNANEATVAQLKQADNLLVLYRSMVIPIILLAYTIPKWQNTILDNTASIIIGRVLLLLGIFSLIQNWDIGFRLSKRITKLAWQYLDVMPQLRVEQRGKNREKRIQNSITPSVTEKLHLDEK